MLIYDKIVFKGKLIMKHKEEHCIMIEGSIHKEDITLANIWPQYINGFLGGTSLKNLLINARDTRGMNLIPGCGSSSGIGNYNT